MRRRRATVTVVLEVDTNLDAATLERRIEGFVDPAELCAQLDVSEFVRVRETTIEVCGLEGGANAR